MRALAVGLLTAGAVTGVAIAANPAAPGIINACSNKKTGALRLIDSTKKGTAGKCRSSETGIVWNATGPAGEPGSVGAGGPIGPAGAQGPAGNAGADGAAGARGAQGADGKPGATGPGGAAGRPGADGARGPQGLEGKPGATGAAGAQGRPGATGAAGARGEPASAGLPSGVTMRGVVSVRGPVFAAGQTLEAPITFPMTIPSSVQTHIIGVGSPDSASCTGNAENPTAAPGHLCVYPTIYSNVLVASGPSRPNFIDPVTTFGSTTVRPYGVTLRTTSSGAGDLYLYAVWAATAP